MPQPIQIKNNASIYLPKHPAKCLVDFNSKEYSIGLENINADLKVYLFERVGDVWTEKLNFLIISGIDTLTPNTPSEPTQVSLHAYNNKLQIIFSAKYDHVASQNSIRWLLQLCEIETTTFTTEFKVVTDQFTLLPLEGPILFDCVTGNNKLYIGHNYGDNEASEDPTQSLAFSTYDGVMFSSSALYQQSEDFNKIYLDYDTSFNKVYLCYNGTINNILYEIFPNVKPVDALFNLDEVQYCSRLYSILGIRAHIGFTKSNPRYISLHNTYFLQVEEDANNLSFTYHNDDLVFYYMSENKLKYAKFNLTSKTFYLETALNDTHSYSVMKDSGVEYTGGEFSRILAQIDKFYSLEFDLYLDAPEIVSPKDGNRLKENYVEYVFKASSEIKNNPLDFSIKINRRGKTFIFKSDIPDARAIWQFNPSGDNITWEDFPDGGITSAHYNKLVKLRVARSSLV